MPSTPRRGFIVRPAQGNTEPEFESLNIQGCSDPYSFMYDEVVSTGRWNTPVLLDTVSCSPVEERIKDKMLEKIENYLERNQFHDLALLVTTYEKFKELHP